VTHIKFIVFETYGSTKTYMNQVMFLIPQFKPIHDLNDQLKIVNEAINLSPEES